MIPRTYLWKRRISMMDTRNKLLNPKRHTSSDIFRFPARAQTKKSVVMYLFSQNNTAAPVSFRPQKHRISSPVMMIASYRKRTTICLISNEAAIIAGEHVIVQYLLPP